MTDAAPRLTPRWRDLLELRPHDRDHWAALRVGLATAVPLLVLWAIGRTDLTMFAVFSAFTAVYGRNFPHLSRLRLQLVAGGAQLLSIALGGAIALAPSRNLLIIPVAALWAFGCSMLGDRVRWAPPGPLFQVFGLAAVASSPATPARYAAGLVVTVASVAFALLIGYIGRVIWRSGPGRLHNPYTKPIVVPPAAHGVVEHGAMFGAGVLLAGAIPAIIGIGHPYWAMVSALAALAVPGGYNRVLRATHRFVGTMVGLGIGALMLAFHPAGLVAILLMVVLQGAAELFVVRNYSLALILLTPLVLVMGELGGAPSLGALIWQRGVETFIGVAVAVAIAIFMERKRGRPVRLDSIHL